MLERGRSWNEVRLDPVNGWKMATIASEREIYEWLQDFAGEDGAKRKVAARKLRQYANVSAADMKKVCVFID